MYAHMTERSCEAVDAVQKKSSVSILIHNVLGAICIACKKSKFENTSVAEAKNNEFAFWRQKWQLLKIKLCVEIGAILYGFVICRGKCEYNISKFKGCSVWVFCVNSAVVYDTVASGVCNSCDKQ
ncbi:hypothetical protein T4B_5296 [Trichinella pseudospiralis]|uniref:Uncharacterized protein n=1 Tax=Trichinella pseudospiralis TaxID=6337 RepID=A0A0V1IA64_TRIPS|nr:hypothetical protein T4B_5296 [Trichinella pseudospiralis]